MQTTILQGKTTEPGILIIKKSPYLKDKRTDNQRKQNTILSELVLCSYSKIPRLAYPLLQVLPKEFLIRDVF